MLALTGCGGGGDDDPGASLSAADQAGAKIFADAGCAGCHTLSAADSKADVGPNLDSTQLSQARIVRQVANGGNGMPAFRGKLTQDQIDQVAAFVAASAKGSGTPVVGKFEPDDSELADCKSGSFECYVQSMRKVA